METNRRQILQILGVISCGGLAGCINNASFIPSNSGSTHRTTTTPETDKQASTPDWNTPTQSARITPGNDDSSDEFGFSVALAGDGATALVGADRGDGSDGTAYVFSQTEESWSQQARLTPDDDDSNDEFGFSVALAGDGATALVGARGDDDPDGRSAGSAYVFSQADGAWSQRAKFAPDDRDKYDGFGDSVELSKDGITALVGTYNAGAAYVFSQTDGAWSQRAKLTPDAGDERDHFGWSTGLSMDGTTALVSTLDDADSNGGDTGSAYVYNE
jgi:hypothetical protein